MCVCASRTLSLLLPSRHPPHARGAQSPPSLLRAPRGLSLLARAARAPPRKARTHPPPSPLLFSHRSLYPCLARRDLCRVCCHPCFPSCLRLLSDPRVSPRRVCCSFSVARALKGTRPCSPVCLPPSFVRLTPLPILVNPRVVVPRPTTALRDYRLFFLSERAARAARAPRERSISFSLLDSRLRCTSRAPSSSPSAESRGSLRCNCLFLSTSSFFNSLDLGCPRPSSCPSRRAQLVLHVYTLHIERLFSPSPSRVYPASPSPLLFSIPRLSSASKLLYFCADSCHSTYSNQSPAPRLLFMSLFYNTLHAIRTAPRP